ncbi:MAG TPA: hypothetical protein VFS92_07340, partial [Planctomycetota bacterium]|nr:hypothetical protein [Planctomycetota bacterium]
RALFTAVQPGSYELVLSLGRTGRAIWPVSRTPVSVEAGAAEMKVAFPPLHPVRIHSKDWVSIRRRDDPNWHCNTDRPGADGVIVLDGLPAGEYTIARGREELPFSVPAAADVVVKD